jgi:hypothetical protein
MKLYSCSNCNNSLYFDNNVCLNCNHPVGFDSLQMSMLTLQKKPTGPVHLNIKTNYTYKYCVNAQQGNCNWLIPASSNFTYCLACDLNRTIPSLTNPEFKECWDKIERAKHRLVYALLRLNLPIRKKINNSIDGIAFDFMADVSPEKKVMTGHDMGVITLNIDEADEKERTKHKLDLGEKYRTLLGHFRHEIGHYYWDQLIKNSPVLTEFRRLFGDETVDYDQALEKYYHSTSDNTWPDQFISIYASSHPWEDWAESWAHYMHIMDTLETAYAFGVGLDVVKLNQTNAASINADPYTVSNFKKLFDMWVPLTFVVNNLNRSMGHNDFYPFVISEKVVEKLSFIHDVCKVNRTVN